jgi:hypothetical protein
VCVIANKFVNSESTLWNIIITVCSPTLVENHFFTDTK